MNRKPYYLQFFQKKLKKTFKLDAYFTRQLYGIVPYCQQKQQNDFITNLKNYFNH